MEFDEPHILGGGRRPEGEGEVAAAAEEGGGGEQVLVACRGPSGSGGGGGGRPGVRALVVPLQLRLTDGGRGNHGECRHSDGYRGAASGEFGGRGGPVGQWGRPFQQTAAMARAGGFGEEHFIRCCRFGEIQLLRDPVGHSGLLQRYQFAIAFSRL